ncbi:MAG: hypothetical protein ACOX6D_07130 [Thermoguttaceae bacterium]|jgi:hypothetical protein
MPRPGLCERVINEERLGEIKNAQGQRVENEPTDKAQIPRVPARPFYLTSVIEKGFPALKRLTSRGISNWPTRSFR